MMSNEWTSSTSALMVVDAVSWIISLSTHNAIYKIPTKLLMIMSRVVWAEEVQTMLKGCVCLRM